MTSVHTIQLRGPWQLKPIARTRLDASGESQLCDVELSGVELSGVEPLPAGGRLNPVGDWSPLLGDFRGVVRYERAFHRPTGLTSETVTLVIEGVDWRGEVRLNDQLLGKVCWGDSLRIDIRERLEARNRLTIDIELPATDAAPIPNRPGRESEPCGGLIGGARLEIS